jgi:hypothetical protein
MYTCLSGKIKKEFDMECSDSNRIKYELDIAKEKVLEVSIDINMYIYVYIYKCIYKYIMYANIHILIRIH